MKRTILTKTD